MNIVKEMKITFQIHLATYDVGLVRHMSEELYDKLYETAREISHDRFLIASTSMTQEVLEEKE